MKKVGVALLVAVFATLSMVGPAAASPSTDYPPKPPNVTVDDSTPNPGQGVIVSGTNWCPGSTVEIFLDGKSVGTAKVGSDGTFSTTISIPAGTTAGEHTITVRGLDSTCQNSQVEALTISVSGGGAAQGGNLPFTGSNISVGMLLLAALVIVGAASVLAGRRRKAHPEK